MITKLYYLLFCSALLFLSNCSPPIHIPVQSIHIATAANVKIISVDESLQKHLNAEPGNRKKKLTEKQILKIARKTEKKAKKEYTIMRSDKPLAVTVQTDSVQKTIYLQTHRDFLTFLNMKYVFRSKDSSDIYAYKQWAYPKRNYISFNDGEISVSRFAPIKNGAVIATISESIPIFNLKSSYGHYNSAGFIAPELGIDYFYRQNRFLSFTLGAATDVLPLPIDYFGPQYIERGSVIYTSVRNNIVMGSFDAGYGISSSRLYWSNIPINDTVHPKIKIRTNSLGLSLSANYRITKNLRAGILYQPNLINLNFSPVFSYQHYLSFHCIWYLHKTGNKIWGYK
ncbi:MAG TPA: hypothetical protein VKI61_12790 [Chitinophagaceae bacterium]|nr:hypothetical protein [Chitinophagaceae bacterium]